jgi:Domain of unknown function (DUF4386)
MEAQIKRDASRYLIGFFSLAAALCYWLIGGTHFLMPKAQIHFATGIKADFFESLASGSAAFQVHYWVFAVFSLFAIGVVLGLRNLLSSKPNVWLHLTEVFALIGFGVTAIDFVMMQSYALRLAGKWPSLDATARAILSASGLPHLDSEGFFGFGLVGLWFGTVNISLFKAKLIPKWLAILGLLGALLTELTFLGTVFHIARLIDLAVGLGGMIIGPIWFIGLGIRMIRTS